MSAVDAVIADNDLSAVNISEDLLFVTEDGDAKTYTVMLNSEPWNRVNVTLEAQSPLDSVADWDVPGVHAGLFSQLLLAPAYYNS